MRALQMLLSSVLCFWSVSLFASDNTEEPAQQDAANHTPRSRKYYFWVTATL
ncbi:Uncharacterised protein [Providencia alcalifaciens]|nr:Uncharacterised protein [Providencia alcalifaciens]